MRQKSAKKIRKQGPVVKETTSFPRVTCHVQNADFRERGGHNKRAGTGSLRLPKVLVKEMLDIVESVLDAMRNCIGQRMEDHDGIHVGILVGGI